MQGECTIIPCHQLCGFGIAVSWLLFDDLRNKRLIPILKNYEALGEDTREGIHVIFPENRLRSSKVGSFLEHLYSSIGDTPYWE